MKGARGVLINITGGLDMTLFEVDEAANRIREEVDPEANIIFGSTFDEKLDGKMRISVVATGIDAEAHRSSGRALAAAGGAETASRDTGSGYMQPVLTQNAAAPACAASPERAGRRRERAEARRPFCRRPGGRERRGAQRRLYRAAAGRSGPARPMPLALPAVPLPAARRGM